jgi:hypothetical protein
MISPLIKERGKTSVYVNTSFKDEQATDPEAGSIQLTKLRISRKKKSTMNGHNYGKWKDFWSNKE